MTPTQLIPEAPGAAPAPASSTTPLRIGFVSLGCPKNLVDSERMLGLLAQDGYALVPDSTAADLVIINTCGFIDAARQESLGVIREMLDRKRDGRLKGVIVAGCLAERQREILLEQVPEVDQVVGVFGREEIARVADRIASTRAAASPRSPRRSPPSVRPRPGDRQQYPALQCRGR